MLTRPLPEWIGSWNRFWFEPSSPMPLGLMRIFAGLLTFYVTLAYSVDLQELFGPHAWIDQQESDAMRHEFPFGGRGSKWDETAPPPADLTREEQEYQQRWPGANPRAQAAKGYPVWSMWFHVTDPTWMVVAHVTILVVIFLFTIGLATRVTSVLAWLGVISYIQRAPTTLFGMDTMMNLMLVYLMIGPSGTALSVDRLIARYWASRRALRAHKPAPIHLEPAPSVSANMALRLLQVNLCIVYLASGLSKLEGRAWWNGTAIWGTMANFEFSPMHWSPYLDFLQFLAKNRWLWEGFMTGGAIFTLCMEIGFPFLIWNRRMRWIMLTMAVMLHTGIAVFMGLNTFSLMMLVFLLAFVPLEATQALLQWLGRGSPHLRVAFDGRSRKQLRVASLLRAVDVWDQVGFQDQAGARRARTLQETAPTGPGLEKVATLTPEVPPPELVSLQLTDEGGEVTSGFGLFERAVYSLRLLWPLAPAAWILSVTGVGNTFFPEGSGMPPVSSPSENGKHKARENRIPS
jgi:hypothetical protein